MKGIKLIVIVLSIITTMHVEAFANESKKQSGVDKISTLEIQAITISQRPVIIQSSQAIARRRKLSTTLRKPIVKKYRSRNYNVC
ncbi:MAG: hypothetical protein V3V00_14635 [Saprospiraceae bacterium]